MKGKVVRTSKGLVDALFDTIDKLNSQEIDPEHARAIAHSARGIVGIAQLELEFRKWQKDSEGEDTLRSLTITSLIPRSPPSDLSTHSDVPSAEDSSDRHSATE